MSSKELAYQLAAPRSVVSRLKGNLGWLLVNHCISQLLSFVGTIYLARILGKAGFGRYSLALVVGQSLWILGDFGVSVLGVRDLAGRKENNHQIAALLTTIKAIASLVVFLIFLLVLAFLPLDASYFWIMLGGGFFVLTNAFNCEWIFKGVERIEFIAIANFIVSLVFVLSIVLFVKDENAVVYAVYLRSFSFLPGAILLIYFVKKILRMQLAINLAHVSRKIIKEAAYYMLTGGMSMVYVNILVLFMGFFRPSEEVGIFNSAYRPIILIIIFGAIVPMAFFPIIADSYYNKSFNFNKIHSSFYIILLSLGLPVAIWGMLLSHDIMEFLYGLQYSDAFPIFRLLICIVPFTFIRLVYGQSLLACGFQKVHFLATAFTTLVLVILGLILIPRYGAFGAAAAFCLSEIFFLFVLFFCFRIYLPHFSKEKKIIMRILLANCIAAAAIHYIRSNFLIDYLVGTIIYSFILWKFGIFSHALRNIKLMPVVAKH